MADVNAEIGVSIDTSNALAQLKSLQREIARFHTSVAKSSEAAALAQRDLQRNFLNGVNAISGFSAELRTVKTTAESFTDSLEKNKFSMREYFRYSMASTKTFGRFFRTEFDTINKVSLENVKRLQTQYIKMGRDASGAMKAIAIIPTKLDLTDLTTQTQMAAQKQALFNQLVKQGSTNLLNFGKNTQWAGRQLMVGFTLPLIGLGSAASKTFMDMETAAIKFRKVYGDLFTPVEEREQAFEDIQALGREFTKYGIALSETISLAADAAAAGFQGLDLQRQVTEATRLQVLGQLDQQKALDTTISLQNAFQLQSEELADSINFLNAVENQTVVSLQDITTAIPKAAPIVRSLGGDVKDLAFFLAAMREGGVNASEAANALKSGLSAIINPTNKAKETLSGFGIDIDKIVEKNVGNLKQTILDVATAINSLSQLDQQRVIAQLFGRFQQARLTALFTNVIKDGNQASRVLDLAGASVEELASLSENELGITANSAMNKFRSSVENLKASLAPIGQVFLEVITPFLENIGNLFDKFNNLSAGTKKVITALVIGIGAIAPVVLMTIGLFANFVANGIKGLLLLRNGYLRLTGQSQILSEQTNYLTNEQQQALAAAASLEQSHMKLQQVFTGEAAAVRALITEYQRMIAAQNTAATRFPAMMGPGYRAKGYIDGVVSVPGPKGAGDIIPAMVSPGEAIIPSAMNEKYAPLVQGIIADNIPGFNGGTPSVAEQFVSTRVGRSATRGERAQVNIPGGYQLGHYSEAIQLTGEQLRILAQKQSQSFKDAVEALIDSVGEDVTRLFDVFTNEVTVQSKELNQALGEIGSGGTAPIELFRQESVAQAGAYNAPILARMKKAGASKEELDNALLLLEQEFARGIEDLGEITEITADQVNDITKKAYDVVADANTKFAEVRESMMEPGALKEVAGVIPGRVSLKGGYNTKAVKDDVNQMVQEMSPGLYPAQQAFNFMGESARKVGIQNAVAIREIFKQLSDEAKTRVIDLLGDIDAMSEQVLIEARNAGIDIGQYAIQGIAQGTEAASPSLGAKRQGQNVVDGFEQGILEGMDDVSLATAELRRRGEFLTDQFGQGILDGMDDVSIAAGLVRDEAAKKLAMPPVNPLLAPVIPGLVGRGIQQGPSMPIDAIKEFESVTFEAADITKRSSENMQKWNSRIMSGSFALSSITGGLSMFGKDLGPAGDIIFKVSSAMFVLQGVVQALTQAKLLELATTRIAAAKQAAAFATYGTGLASRGGILGSIGRIGTFATKLLSLNNPIGLAVTAFTLVAAGVFAYNKIQEAARKRIEGLGDAALMTGEKVSKLGEYFGTELKTFTFESFKFEGATAGPAMVGGRRQEVEKLIASDAFKEYKDDVKALQDATAKEARLVLENIIIQLQAKGMAKEQIEIFIDALKKESGQNDVELDFNSIDLNTEEGQKELENNVDQLISVYNKKFSKGINDAYKRNLNLTGKSIAGIFGSLQLQLEGGSISADEYAKQIANINTQILNISDSQSKFNLINTIFKGMGEDAVKAAKGVENLNDKLLLSQAILLGVASETLISGLQSDELLMQDISRRGLQAAIEKYFEQFNKIIEGINDSKVDGNKSDKDGLTLQEKLIKIYKKQIEQLQRKAKALKDVNDEIDRNNQYIQDQMDLQTKITEAKISGNYLEAAALTQQRLMRQSEFNRETQEIEIQRQIDRIEERIRQLENDKKKVVLTAAEKRLLNISGKGSAVNKKQAPAEAKEITTNAAKILAKSYSSNKTIGPSTMRQAEPRKNIPNPPSSSFNIAFNPQTGKWENIGNKRKPAGHISYLQWLDGVKKYSVGGPISGPGTPTSDSVPIWASDGEFMWSEKAVSNAGGPNAVAAMHEYFRNAQGLKDGGRVKKYFANIAKQNAEYKGFGSGLLNAGPSASMARIFGGMRKPGDILNAIGAFVGLPVGRLAGKAAGTLGSKVANYKSFMSETEGIIHRSAGIIDKSNIKQIVDPRAASGRMGPGTYFAPSGSVGGYPAYGDFAYTPELSKMAKITAFLRNYRYADANDAASILGIKYLAGSSEFSDLKMQSPEIQKLLKMGIVGIKTTDTLPTLFKQPNLDMVGKELGEMTNLLIGTKGFGLKQILGPTNKAIVDAAKQREVKEIVKGIQERYLIKSYSMQRGRGLAKGGYIDASMMASLPQFKKGIDNVPYDMPAILHKGERVLTEAENKKYTQNSSTVNATFNITGDNPRDIANQVMLQLERITNKNNKSNKVFG